MSETAAPRMKPRPTSPHLTIYRLPLTGPILSIVHRGTEVAIAAGLLLVTWFCCAVLAGPDAYNTFLDFTRSIIGRIMMLGWTWALVFHTLYDIRQLFFDMGKGFSLQTITQSGIMVLLASFIVTALVWLLAFTATAPRMGGI